MVMSGNGGKLSATSETIVGTGTRSLLTFTGIDQTSAGTFSTLPTCASALEGARAAVTDSTTAVWGATVTGSGGNHVGTYCNGTNWTVYAK